MWFCSQIVFEAERLELRQQLLEVRVGMDPDVRRAEKIVLEAGRGHFPRDAAAANPWIALDHTDRKSAARQPGAAGEAVMAAASNHDIEAPSVAKQPP